MVKEKRILSYFIGWLIVGFCIIFAGVNKIFALTYEDIGYLREQTGMTIEVSYETESSAPLIVEQGQEVYTQIKAVNLSVENYTFNAGVHYQLEIQLPNLKLTEANYYEVYDQNNNRCSISNTLSIFGTAYPRWNFQCNSQTNSIYIRISNNSNTDITELGTFSWKSPYLRYTNASIDSSDSENTDKIINNNNENTDKVIDNNNENTDKIIESNKETQEVIKDQFNDCHMSYNLLSFSKPTQTINGLTITNNGDGTLTLNGTTTDVVSMTISDVMSNLEIGTYYYSINASGSVSGSFTKIMYGRNNSTAVNLSSFSSITNNGLSFTTSYLYEEYYFYLYIPSERTFTNYTIKPMLNKGSTAMTWEPYGKEICTNKIDDTNDKLDGIQGALTDSSSPDTSGLENSAGWLPAGPLDSILNLPLTMLNSLTNSLGKTCAPLNLTLPYVNKNIKIPCLSTIFAQITGVNSLWTWVGTIASVLILYNYLLNLYAWVDRVLTLRAEFDEAMGADMANWGRL